MSHEKNACDCAKGTVKQLAALASLWMVCNDQIMTCWQLYDCAKNNIVNINFFLFSTTEAKILKGRLETTKTIMDTQLFYNHSPVNKSRVLVKIYSFSEEPTVEIVSANDANNDLVTLLTL